MHENLIQFLSGMLDDCQRLLGRFFARDWKCAFLCRGMFISLRLISCIETYWTDSFGGTIGLSAYSDFGYQVLFTDESSVGAKGFDLSKVQTKNEPFVLSKASYFLALIGLFEFKIWSFGMSLCHCALCNLVCRLILRPLV
jgi:hypothetical protein